jgi:23S rRNA (pseudouridine1915-N3)-methyltransferase
MLCDPFNFSLFSINQLYRPLFMDWRIITVGKPGHAWVKAALELYWQRLKHHGRFEHIVIKEGSLAQVEAQMTTASEHSLRVVLDERGKQLRSVELAKWIEKQQISARKRVSVLIGGADGHSDSFRASADVCWSLSSLTLQHDVALVVLAEQLYRAHAILRGEPYHREG